MGSGKSKAVKEAAARIKRQVEANLCDAPQWWKPGLAAGALGISCDLLRKMRLAGQLPAGTVLRLPTRSARYRYDVAMIMAVWAHDDTEDAKAAA